MHILVMVPLLVASLQPLSTGACAVLLANARVLEGSGDTHSLLRGKQLALLSESENEEDGGLFCSAAADLGAHVSHIRPGISALSQPDVLQRTGRMLGRLYDAIECQGLTHELVENLALEAGVPVYEGLATAHHPTARLTDLMGGEHPEAKRREIVLKSALLSTLM